MSSDHRAGLLALLAAGALALTGPSMASPPGSPIAPGGEMRGCTFYQHAEYQGERDDIVEGDDIAWIGEHWNDQISSIRCMRSCRLVVYEHVDYGGASGRFTGWVPYVGDFWNDRISSMRVSCAARLYDPAG